MTSIVLYEEKYKSEWDDLVAASPMGTFLHTREFLNYHGDRFVDKSLLIYDDKNRLSGVVPAAVDQYDDTKIVSHPGSSYGGIVHNRSLLGAKLIDALQLCCKTYSLMGYSGLLYKVTPYIYHLNPASDDIYALFRSKAKLVRCDLTATVDIENIPNSSSRRRRGLKKAIKSGLNISDDINRIDEFWGVLGSNLKDKHNAEPVHSLEEIKYLYELFKNNIKLITAVSNEEIVAGTLLFLSKRVMHAQYIASSGIGYNLSALDLVFRHCIDSAEKDGFRYFDFGISNEESGMYLNEGLYKFKTEFGAGGVVHQFYELALG